MAIVYKYDGSLYVNLTNRCTSSCVFCIKNKWKGKYRGYDLRLKREPSAEEVIKAIKDPKKYQEIVFCGYGEPLIKIETLKKVAAWVKKQGGYVRLNTSGHGNLIHNRNILKELIGLVDSISISLNASNAKQYFELHHPQFGIGTFSKVISFIRQAGKYIPDVTLTCISMPGIDINKCKQIAKKLKVKFRLRPYL